MQEYNSERQNRESRYGEYNDLNLTLKSGFHTPPLAGFVVLGFGRSAQSIFALQENLILL
jgi:hypothetical protein